MDNTKGATTAFATFSHYRSHFWSCYSWASLIGAVTKTAEARKPAFLHTAQFVRVTPWRLRRLGISSKQLKFGGLLFLSAYNGDAEVYFRGFSQPLAPVMDEVWRTCEGWRGAQPFENLDAFIQAYRRRSSSFFNAYPATAKRLRASLVLRRQVDKLAALANVSDSPEHDEAFKTAFGRVGLLQWGNLRPTKEDL